MELLRFQIPWRDRRDHSPLVIAPIGDIQWAGSHNSNNPTAVDILKRHIDRTMAMGAWYIGLGDYGDFASPSNRQRLRAAALYDTAESVVSDKALELMYDLYETVLKPTTGHWIGMVHGHHWAQLETGETTDQRLCQMLKTRFLGTSAYVRVTWSYKPEKSPRDEQYNVTLFVHHGCGGGIKAAAPLNKLENLMPYWDADIFLMGHMTKQVAAPINRVTPRWVGPGAPDLIHRKLYLVGCGGFAKGYVQDSKVGQIPMGGYVEQRMLNPTSLGAPLIRISPNIHRTDTTLRGRRIQSRHWSPSINVEI